MTAQAAEWSERDLDRRFALGPPHDELTELAAHARQPARPARGEPAPRAALLGRALARATDAARADRRRVPSSRWREPHPMPMLPRRDSRRSPAARRSRGRSTRSWPRHATTPASAACPMPPCRRLDRCPRRDHRRGSVTIRTEPDGPLRIAVDADLAARILEPVLDNACATRPRAGSWPPTPTAARSRSSWRRRPRRGRHRPRADLRAGRARCGGARARRGSRAVAVPAARERRRRHRRGGAVGRGRPVQRPAPPGISRVCDWSGIQDIVRSPAAPFPLR